MTEREATGERVIRSALVDSRQMIVMNGDDFEDGKHRFVISDEVPPEEAARLAAALEARDAAEDHLRAVVNSINRILDR